MVSVVVTAYNVEEYIAKCLDSIMSSQYKDFEIVVVDDSSTDRTADIVRSYINTNGQIRLIQKNINEGAGLGRRTGVENANGDFILFVDADDWISDTFIQSLVNRQKETDADMTCGGVTILHANGAIDTKVYGEKVSEGMQKFLDYGNGDIIFLNNKLVRKSMYDIVQYSGRRYVEDTPTILPLMYYANKLAYVNDPGYFYLQREGSLCHDGDSRQRQIKSALFKALCSKDMIEFFKTKEDEYKNIISVPEFIQYVNTLKALNPTQEELSKYSNEFAELMLYVLSLIQIS